VATLRGKSRRAVFWRKPQRKFLKQEGDTLLPSPVAPPLVINMTHIDVTKVNIVNVDTIFDHFVLLPNKMTVIEHLPDEIWLEIFSYIPYLDLFSCFSRLNDRINGILREKRLKFKFKNQFIYEKSQFLIEQLSEYIIGLCIEYHKQDIDIYPFKNLVSLHLSHVTDHQMFLIRSNYFKYLNQLNIIVCSTNDQLGDILFGENQLDYLITCWFPNLDDYFQDKKSYRSCLTLRSLRLNYCHMNTFFKLLCFLPNLISFESALVPLPLSYQSISFPSIEHLTLTRLKIVLRDHVPITDVKSMLLYVPCLEQFYLNINRSDILEETLNLIQLISLLESRIPIMTKCDIQMNLFSANVHIKHDDFKKISPLLTQINLYTPETHVGSDSAWLRNLLAKIDLSKQPIIS
jgi:hypothetical protein